VHRRLVQTVDMVNSLREMYDKLDRIEEMLAQDRADPLGPANNLLPVHYHLTQLETFKNETTLRAKRASAESRETLDKYFQRLTGTIEAFESFYLLLAGSLLDIVKAGNPAVAVKIAKIAELEGQRDEKAIAIRLVKKQNSELAARFRSVHAEARVIKHYRAKVMDAIRGSARNAIERAHAKHGSAIFEKLDFIYKDLIIVEDSVSPLFPSDWKIYTAWIKAYHKALYDFLKTFVSSVPDAGALLGVAQFVKEYYKNMTKELEIPDELLVPRLLDGKEQDLVEDYLRLIVQKMDEWTTNLMKTEVDEFTVRDHPPEEDADGFYGMQGAVIMFQSAFFPQIISKMH
jgi:exocyst complex component 3